ncbi:MAG: peroxidase [Fidelibacterota bacterium]
MKREYDAAIRRKGKVFNVLKVMSLNPDGLKTSVRHYLSLMYGSSPLSRAQREMLAVVVSSINNCFY